MAVREDPADAVRRLVAAAPSDPGLAAPHAVLNRLCWAAVTGLDLSGAAIHLATAADDWGVAATADDASAVVARLRFATGEGPSVEALSLRRPVMVSDLGRAEGRWPGFASQALELGVQAVFSFPLQVGAVRLGTLDLYSAHPRVLTGEETALAVALATAVTRSVLDRRGSDGVPWEPALADQSEIYQAQGMVMVDLGVPLAEALVRLRAHAFARGIPLVELARAVIAGLSLADDGEAHDAVSE